MMSIGQNLEEDDINDDEDQAMKHRVDAVWRHRQDKIKDCKDKKRPAIMNLLACGGGKSKDVRETISLYHIYTIKYVICLCNLPSLIFSCYYHCVIVCLLYLLFVMYLSLLIVYLFVGPEEVGRVSVRACPRE